ncbi:MAG: PssE/Cps14G family polysaccharide biosynthesis glycosyltransferase [Candidatus Hydrothermarchaeaceae archaeon]
MIFVMVGTHNRGFGRLVKEMDKIAENEEVVIQTGNTKYRPKNAKYFDFAGLRTIHDYIEKADVVVAHGGIGCVTDSLQYGKPLVIVPRLKRHNEHTNDHQLDLAGEIEKEGKAIIVLDIERLEDAIKDSLQLSVHKMEGEDKVVGIINDYLRSLT